MSGPSVRDRKGADRHRDAGRTGRPRTSAPSRPDRQAGTRRTRKPAPARPTAGSPVRERVPGAGRPRSRGDPRSIRVFRTAAPQPVAAPEQHGVNRSDQREADERIDPGERPGGEADRLDVPVPQRSERDHAEVEALAEDGEQLADRGVGRKPERVAVRRPRRGILQPVVGTGSWPRALRQSKLKIPITTRYQFCRHACMRKHG